MLRPALFESSGPLYFNNLFHDFFNNGFHYLDNFNTDVIDNGNTYLLQAELPGFNKEEININLDNDTLTITANHKEEKNEKENSYIRQERSYQSYCRSFHIPGIKKEDISASYNDGILEISLPKDSNMIDQPQKIEIK